MLSAPPGRRRKASARALAWRGGARWAYRLSLSPVWSPSNWYAPLRAMLETEIELESARVAGGGRSLASKAVEFQRLALEKEFADKQLASALASLEQARNEAQRQQLYLERIVQPSLPDAAMEPRRVRNILTTLVLGLVAWGVLTMIVAGIKEHLD